MRTPTTSEITTQMIAQAYRDARGRRGRMASCLSELTLDEDPTEEDIEVPSAVYELGVL